MDEETGTVPTDQAVANDATVAAATVAVATEATVDRRAVEDLLATKAVAT